RAALDETAAMAAIENGFRELSAGSAQLMAVGHLQFASPPGDCHAKGAAIAGDPFFVIKLATSFYRNPEMNLPSSNGFMVVMSAQTGLVQALLHDEGFLTDKRTAMAGAIAARVIARPGTRTLGIVGSGTQARMQAQTVARTLGIDRILVWARNGEKAVAFANQTGGTAVALDALCARADLIVTTTPSTAPIISASMLRPGARIVAVGADAPGKRELDLDLVSAARLVVDSRAQCIDHGEAGWAVRAGRVRATDLIELGELLTSPVAFRDDETVIADLTGVGVQDLAIASSVWARIAPAPG
ncbi:MAG TPA: NAD(P)-dependent oxidoreductase, partial [Rhodopila sp.]